MSHSVHDPTDRNALLARIRRFTSLTRNDELRALVWRLGELVADEECPVSIVEACKSNLNGLVGAELQEKLLSLLADYESRVDRLRKRRGRMEAIRLSRDMTLHNQRRDFYFGLSEDDLHAIWNGGENDLSKQDRELVRLALRNRLGIAAAVEPGVAVCPTCFLPVPNCVCERGWR